MVTATHGLTKADRTGNATITRTLLDGPLAQGADEAAVRATERMLKLAGFDPGVVDTRFTTKTTDALRRFQGSVGLPSTGALDDATFTALKKVQGRVREKDGFVGVGQAGPRVLRAEQRLQKLGYNTGAADGVYDRDTALAVRAFMKDQKDLKDYSGATLGTVGQKALARETRELAHAPEHRRVRPSNEHRRLDAATATLAARQNVDGTTGFGEGERGRAVRNVQARLRAAGYDPQHQDGVFDERTAGALRAFQAKSGLPSTGRVDSRTWSKLKSSYLYARTGTSPAQRVGERSGAVMATEKALQRLHINPGRADGLFDRRTGAAVRAFERKHHRHVDGQVSTGDLKAIQKAVHNDLGPLRVTNGYNMGSPFRLRTATVEGKPVEEHTARAYKAMEAAARRDGLDLNLISGFRTMDEQRRLYAAYKNGTGNLAARPGYSNHQNGRALDLNVQTGSSDPVGVGRVYNWLAGHAQHFGFRRIAAEAWHWEYQGHVGY